jgi:hypothetical protein
MAQFDVFNGDADGLCALQQLRLAEPAQTTLITGVKRDIALLQRLPAVASGDHITVLDISLDKNREALLRLLGQGATVRYFDHHFPGEIPSHVGFEPHIDTTADRGTSLLVDDDLQGRFRAWAVVGTFGDNFDASARRAAQVLELSQSELDQLKELGIYLNYNGYGATPDDLHFTPERLFAKLHPYVNPLTFIAEDDAFAQLRGGYHDDMAQAARVSPSLRTERHAVYVLPAESWARRVSGVMANELAQGAKGRAHALLTALPAGGFVVSVRAPLAAPAGADDLCRGFPSGGGRKAAAGINHLPDDAYDDFVRAFTAAFQ